MRSLDGATWEAPSGTSSCTRGPPAASAHEMLRRHGGPWGAFSGQPSPVGSPAHLIFTFTPVEATLRTRIVTAEVRPRPSRRGGARGWPVMAATSSSPHPVLARRLQFSAWWLAASSAARVGPSGQPTEKGLQEIWPPERKPRLSLQRAVPAVRANPARRHWRPRRLAGSPSPSIVARGFSPLLRRRTSSDRLPRRFVMPPLTRACSIS